MKLVATRDQGFTIATYRAETRHQIRIGAQKDGKITSFQHEGWEVTSRPDAYSVAGVEDSARLYGFGAVKTDVTLVHADRNTPGFMRSPPVVPYIYALESAMDELAVKLNMDPVELRRVNDSMTDATGKEWSSRSLMKCYDQAAQAFGWSKRTAEPGSMRDGDWLIGWGCASAVYPTHIGAATARVRLHVGRARPRADRGPRDRHRRHDGRRPDGRRAARHSARAVQVELGDSNLPPAPVAGGSNQTASCCSVVMKACDAIMAKLNAAPAAKPKPSAAPDRQQPRAQIHAARRLDARGIRRIHSARCAAQCRRRVVQQPDQEALRRHADFGRRLAKARS